MESRELMDRIHLSSIGCDMILRKLLPLDGPIEIDPVIVIIIGRTQKLSNNVKLKAINGRTDRDKKKLEDIEQQQQQQEQDVNLFK